MDLIEKSDTNHRHPWELARFKVVKSIIDKHVDDYTGKNVLDLGCGDLYFLDKFSNNKPDAKFYAIDTAFNKSFINSSRNSPIKLYQSLENLPENENLIFDVVFLMDVIEHIENDIDFLISLVESRYVSVNTLFLITVPAYQSLFCNHDRFLGHYRRYTNSILESTIKKTGLVSLKKGYFFFSLLLPRFLEVFKEKKYTREKAISGTGLTYWNSNKFITNTIKNWLLLDFKISETIKKLGITAPGLSNYVLCKKRV